MCEEYFLDMCFFMWWTFLSHDEFWHLHFFGIKKVLFHICHVRNESFIENFICSNKLHWLLIGRHAKLRIKVWIIRFWTPLYQLFWNAPYIWKLPYMKGLPYFEVLSWELNCPIEHFLLKTPVVRPVTIQRIYLNIWRITLRKVHLEGLAWIRYTNWFLWLIDCD